ncbi:uncharacterized protein LOC136041407 isoform X2 [Artemia franciscana]|uniref:uncharacterized protein LOC136041407 isoform X2 n=1 Tax=Artemia franciscana TaxID=6661 RepID=UPI0032DA79EE
MRTDILFYIPNIIDYIRIIFLAFAVVYRSNPWTCLSLYSISILLDGLDGVAARKFDQVSEFGAWLDVVIDNAGRAFLWSNISEVGFLISSLEWITFICNHSMGSEWKNLSTAPYFVRKVMGNGFKTPMGVLAVGSLQCLPIWLFIQDRNLLELSFFVWFPGAIIDHSKIFSMHTTDENPTDRFLGKPWRVSPVACTMVHMI